MNNIEKFSAQSKRRRIYSYIFIFFMASSLVIDFLHYEIYVSSIGTVVSSVVLKAIGLAFILLALKNVLCPSCKSIAGSGRNITICERCGEKLK